MSLNLITHHMHHSSFPALLACNQHEKPSSPSAIHLLVFQSYCTCITFQNCYTFCKKYFTNQNTVFIYSPFVFGLIKIRCPKLGRSALFSPLPSIRLCHVLKYSQNPLQGLYPILGYSCTIVDFFLKKQADFTKSPHIPLQWGAQ